MLVILNDGTSIQAVTSKKPKMNCHAGHTWDYFLMNINGQQITVHYDSTWGRYGYFELNDHWYRIGLLNLGKF